MALLRECRNAALDGNAFVSEFLLKLGPDVYLVKFTVVKIVGYVIDFHAAGPEFPDGEIEELGVVRLERKEGTGPGESLVFIDECPVGKPSLGFVLAGPGVAEVDEDPVDLTLSKEFFDDAYVLLDEEDVLKFSLSRLLDRCEDYGRLALESNIEHIRVGFGLLGRKLALAAAQLEPKLAIGRETACFPPVAFVGFGIVKPVTVGALHPLYEVALGPHSCHIR